MLTAIRETIPTKAPVEAQTSPIINKRLCFFIEFHSELVYRSVYEYIQRHSFVSVLLSCQLICLHLQSMIE